MMIRFAKDVIESFTWLYGISVLQADKGRTEAFIDNLPGGPDVHQSCPKCVVLDRFLVRS